RPSPYNRDSTRRYDSALGVRFLDRGRDVGIFDVHMIHVGCTLTFAAPTRLQNSTACDAVLRTLDSYRLTTSSRSVMPFFSSCLRVNATSMELGSSAGASMKSYPTSAVF